MSAKACTNITLATQCLEFCQQLINKGIPFNCSVKVDTFLFSLEYMGDIKENVTKKKTTTSQRRKNGGQQSEFLDISSYPAITEVIEEVTEKVTGTVTTAEDFKFKCEQCGKVSKTGRTLATHMKRMHVTPQ